MPLKAEAIEEPGINLTPMIDIVFLLVVFFVVASKFSEGDEQQIEINLPDATAARPLTSLPDEIIVTVSQTGEFSIAGTVVTAEQLETMLREAKDRYDEQTVRIRGDAKVAYERVIQVLDICKRRVGIKSIALATEPIERTRP